ncbi:type II toxin-antitoxin system RelE family toxin [Nostoc sp. CCY0012]|uniref:type II toxin-antitoxin system RelE family toxin n=1 Tax=Nostoc sp. CCY0012 TaxID=1056123 RepID=UPI0039C62FB3
MKSRTTARFRKAFAVLPEAVQQQTRKAYRQFKQDPEHPSLRFKKVHPQLPIYSARISRIYRAVGLLEGDTVIWFWVGSHAEYDMLLSQL